jgi:hypothetical protein
MNFKKCKKLSLSIIKALIFNWEEKSLRLTKKTQVKPTSKNVDRNVSPLNQLYRKS